jgi:hypothetical protein
VVIGPSSIHHLLTSRHFAPYDGTPFDSSPQPEQGPPLSTSTPTPDFEKIRADFPRARTAAYFDNASSHPLSTQSANVLRRYADWLEHDVGEPWWPTWAKDRDKAHHLFAQLINADRAEVAFARSTVEAESNVLNG